MSKGESKEYRTRLKEITSVLHKYGITRGITPQKLRMILEDLGPTYIKIGQIHGSAAGEEDDTGNTGI